jgi:hypothetical protein
MRTIIFTILISAGFSLSGQTDSTSRLSSLDLYFGFRNLDQSFYNQLNTTDKINPSMPLRTIGIGESGVSAVTRNFYFYGHLIYNHVIPQTIIIQDSIKGKITGFIFSGAFGGVLKTKSERLALIYYTGFNTGRLRMFQNELIRQKNPFFSPKIGLQPKINFGPLSLTFFAEYEYDISKSSWRKTSLADNNKIKINTLRQTGITGQIGIGYVIN